MELVDSLCAVVMGGSTRCILPVCDHLTTQYIFTFLTVDGFYLCAASVVCCTSAYRIVFMSVLLLLSVVFCRLLRRVHINQPCRL